MVATETVTLPFFPESSDDLANSSADILDLVIAEIRIQRQSENLRIHRCHHGQILRLITELLPVVWVHVQWSIMHTGTDAGLLQSINEFAAVDEQAVQAQAKDKQMPGMNAIRFLLRQD